MPEPIRDQLAEVLHARAGDLPGPATNCRACMGDADALLPLVESYAAQQAAEALRKAVRENSISTHRLSPVEALTLRVVKVFDLWTRADALDPGAPQ